MSTIDRLFSDFVDAWNRGEDPRVEDAEWDAGIPERGAFARAAADLLERVGCST